MSVVAQIGFGYWGPNLARNLNAIPDVSWRYLVDLSADRREQASSLYPHITVTGDLDAVLADADVTAVIVSTPAATHLDIASRALNAGKHVLVEKPLALSLTDAVTLARLADDRGLVLMVGHTFEFVPAVRAMRDLIVADAIGEPLYLHTQRLNLGRIQSDINAFWSIGPHDVSIANFLLDGLPEWVTAQGARYLHDHVEDVVFVTAGYPKGKLAHMHVSWLDPLKTRRVTVVGSRKMLVYDDLDVDARLKIFDKGADRAEPDAYGTWHYQLRDGQLSVPALDAVEPLTAELVHFFECARTSTRPVADGWNGARVVAVCEAVDASLNNGGARVNVVMPDREIGSA